MSLQIGTRLGAYEVLGPLGAGGMGEVYKARDPRVERLVALKVVPEEFFESEERRQRFEREAKLLASLNHPGIATLFSFEEVAGPSSSSPSRHILVMELLEGETLRGVLQVRLSLRRTLALATQIAEALAFAHEAGIVHRDLKPENVMVTGEDRVKVLDLGLARRTHSEADGSRAATATGALTGTGFVVGTAAYMSPEQAAGGSIDFRSDQFAFGGMLYEMLSGRRAFARPTAAQTLAAIIEDEPEPLSTVAPTTPVPLRWIVERCLAKRPEDRYASTRDLARELANLRDHLSDLGPSGVHQAGVGSRRRRVPPAIAVLLMLAGLAAVFAAGHRFWPATPRALRFEQITFGQWGIWNARFAPDGSVVFSAPASRRDDRGVPVHELFAIRPGTPEPRPLGIAGNILAISRVGEMAILQTSDAESPGTLALVPLGGGSPREILEGVLHTADWSPDGKSLAVLHHVDGKTRLEFPVGHPIREAAGTRIRIAPDGKRLILQGPGTFIVDLEGNLRALGRGDDQAAEWAGDGRSLRMTRVVGADTEIVSMGLDGASQSIATIPGQYVFHDLSPDGRALAERFSTTRAMRSRDREGRERELGWLDESWPAGLSGDGRLLLFNVTGAGGGPSGSIYVRGTDGGPPKKIATGLARSLSRDGKWALCSGAGGTPPLSLVPTGAGEVRTFDPGPIVRFGLGGFLADGTGIWFNGSEAGRPFICYVQAFAGGPPRPLPAVVENVLAISPDGAELAVWGGTGKAPELVSAGSGERRPVPGSEPGEMPIGWSPDGRTFYLITARWPVTAHRIELASGRREHVAQFDLDDSYVPEGFNVFVSDDGRSWVYGAERFSSDLFIVEGLR